MVVCKYFLQGNCRFGDNCKYEHPREQRNISFASQNRFGVFQSPASSSAGGTTGRKDTPYNINISDVKNELTDGKGRPKWLLSTYGPGKNPPASLFEGSEYSFEELRARFYELRANGKIDEANQEANNLWAMAEQRINQVLNNVENIGNFMEEAEKKHPNRLDFAKVDGTKSRDQIIKEAESGNSLGASSGFGHPSAFTKPTTTFGQPTSSSGFGSGGFGQPAQPSSFGKPSGTFGQPTTSTFGKPSIGFGQPSFGQSAQPVFGQPAQPTSAFGQLAQQAPVFGQSSQPAPVFGQPAQPSSAFGKPAFGSTGFGQPSALGNKSPFAAPSAGAGFAQSSFGQSSQPTPSFGQPSQPTSGFSQSSQPSSGFGQSAQPKPFGQPLQPSPFSQPNVTSSGFAQNVSTLTSGSASIPAFGKPPTATPTFGQPSSQSSSPFGAKSDNKGVDADNPMASPTFSPAGGVTANSNPFAVSTPQSALSSSDSQAARKPSHSEVGVFPPNINSSATPHPLTNKAPRPLHYTQTIPSTAPTTTDPATGKLQRYRGRQVQYINDSPCYERPDGKGWERIWFPQQGQAQEVVYLGRADKIRDLVAEEERYTDELTHEYSFLFEMGNFKDGKMPIVPPKREWCLYDF